MSKEFKTITKKDFFELHTHLNQEMLEIRWKEWCNYMKLISKIIEK